MLMRKSIRARVPPLLLSLIGPVGEEGCFRIWILHSYVDFLLTFLVDPKNQDDPRPFFLFNIARLKNLSLLNPVGENGLGSNLWDSFSLS